VKPLIPLLLAVLAVLAIPAPAADQEFRAARSVHLGYVGMEGDAFYNEMVVEKSTDGSYFMACGWDTGYFGVQQIRGDKKVVIFSVWDPIKGGDDPTAVKTEDRVEVLFSGADTRIKRFGGEGTGGQCMKDFNWRIGETNRFVIHALTETNNALRKTAYTAYLQENGAWQKLATFRVQTKTPDMRGFYSFVEDFRRDKKSVFDQRRARFGAGWVRKNADWKPITKARFTASNATWESKDNIDAGLADGWFYLATGGDIKASHELRSVIELPPAPRDPPNWKPQ
jgi:hypothetical protein